MLGLTARVLPAILSATSHDFWLSFLLAPVWNTLHLLIYPAYAHLALGYFQDRENPVVGAISYATSATLTDTDGGAVMGQTQANVLRLDRGDLHGLQLRGGKNRLKLAEDQTQSMSVPVEPLGRWKRQGGVCDR